jgi:hypothetical protein
MFYPRWLDTQSGITKISSRSALTSFFFRGKEVHDVITGPTIVNVIQDKENLTTFKTFKTDANHAKPIITGLSHSSISIWRRRQTCMGKKISIRTPTSPLIIGFPVFPRRSMRTVHGSPEIGVV